MAKVKKSTTKEKSIPEFSFIELDSQLSKISGFEMGSILTENTFSEVDEWISTGNYILNAQLSGSLFGGIPNTRSLGLMGDPGTGKSFVCLNVAREAQKAGYHVIYCDTEGAVDKDSAIKFGIDPTKLRYQPIKTVSQFMTFVTNLIKMVEDNRKKGIVPKILLIVDSLGMLSTDKEIDDALRGHNAADMGAKAKELRKLFRVITLDLTSAKIPMICTNHVYAGGGFFPTKESSGGDGPIFAMSVISFLSKAQLKGNDGSTKTGIIVTSNLKKSRFTIPNKVKFHISWTNGMNPYVGLEEYVGWDICGIARGKFEEIKDEGGKTIKIFKENPSSTRWGIKHLDKTVTASQLFTAEIFTKDVLKQLDENAIKKAFLLPDLVDNQDIVDALEKSVEENEQKEN